ncbi:metallopeptidase family protein [Sphingobium nicotianae]|uniref:Metallopeptidase family protein n=1 Tax=Sphingobium nicotianae TaxID=2782607 RepID=A0A9X1IPC2_9SPHN|nr:metallopeptidase family protein [Sphingobium nicotianae]MBT2186012.1 metallopeptidase family protein [Sphingobium nicotianae]
MAERGQTAPDAERIERLARQAVAAMPALFRDHLGDVAILVEEFADEGALADLGIEDPWELSGLYEGRPLTEQSIWSSGDMPPRIRLFRRPLLDEWAETGVTLEDLITHVLIHEVGHHFGFSDEDMHAIEDGLGQQG